MAASGSSIKSYGEKKIVGYTDNGEAVSMRVQCADVKKVPLFGSQDEHGGKCGCSG